MFCCRRELSNLWKSYYNAIDGNHVATYKQASCSHTEIELNPWWRLDLGKTHKVFSLSITSYKGNVDGINGAEIRIRILWTTMETTIPGTVKTFTKHEHVDLSRLNESTEYNFSDRCAAIATIPPGFTETFQCNGMDGQYINIVIPGKTAYLVLCEVEVFGSRQQDSLRTYFSNLATN